MTVSAMMPFHGASREGVEFIERWIRESRNRTGDLLVSTAAKHNEALSEIATSSKAAYEMQWAHFFESQGDRRVNEARRGHIFRSKSCPLLFLPSADRLARAGAAGRGDW